MPPTQKVLDFWTGCLSVATPASPQIDIASVDVLLASVQEAAVAAVTPEQVAIFRDALAAELAKRPHAWISVDYQPGHVLTGACEAAGIDSEWLFPVKTSTYIRDDVAYVRKGYGAAEEAL